jgi:hypothetical protein
MLVKGNLLANFPPASTETKSTNEPVEATENDGNYEKLCFNPVASTLRDKFPFFSPNEIVFSIIFDP